MLSVGCLVSIFILFIGTQTPCLSCVCRYSAGWIFLFIFLSPAFMPSQGPFALQIDVFRRDTGMSFVLLSRLTDFQKSISS